MTPDPSFEPRYATELRGAVRESDPLGILVTMISYLQNRGSQVRVLSPLCNEAPATVHYRTAAGASLFRRKPGLVTNPSPDADHEASMRRVYGHALRLGIATFLAVLALMIGVLGVAHAAPEVTTRQCISYGAVHHFTTGRSAAAARRACMLRRQAALLEMGLPLPFELSLIRACESGRRAGGRGIPGTFDYTAQNKRSTASGAYQYLDTTWGGTGGYAHAKDAPRRVQDERALRNYRAGDPNSPWNESRGCWG